MDDLEAQLDVTPTAELERMLRETEEFVKEVREEIESRRLKAQHFAIDHLDEHLKEARGKWSDLKHFLEVILSELRR